MPSPTTNSPTVATNDSSGGSTAWTITSVTNCVCAVDKTTSYYLEMTSYGFSLPTASALAGIEVAITLGVSGGSGNLYAQMLSANNLVGTSKDLQFTTTGTTFGGATDLWGVGALSVAEIAASGFGVSIWVTGNANGSTATISGATIKLYYAEGGPSGPPGSSTSGHFLFTWII